MLIDFRAIDRILLCGLNLGLRSGHLDRGRHSTEDSRCPLARNSSVILMILIVMGYVCNLAQVES